MVARTNPTYQINPMTGLSALQTMGAGNYSAAPSASFFNSPINPNFSPVASGIGGSTIPGADIAQQLASFGQAGSGPAEPSLLQYIVGGELADGSKINGVGPVGLGLANSLFSGWMGMKNYGLAKDQLKFSKEAFNKNFQAQANLINSELEDRQRKRVRTDPGKAQGVAEYMSQYGVKA